MGFIEEHASEQVTIQVNGQSVTVPLEELAKGYMRQADYTQKTQGLAAQRQAVEAQLQFMDLVSRDPEKAIGMIVEHHGLDLAEIAGVDPQELDGEDPTSVEKLVQKITQQFQREITDLRNELQTSEARQGYEKQLDQLASQDPQLDRGALLQFARDNGITNLDIAYKAMTYDQRSTEEPKAQRSELEEAFSFLEAEKARDLGQMLDSGSMARLSTDPDALKVPESVGEAFQMALRSSSQT